MNITVNNTASNAIAVSDTAVNVTVSDTTQNITVADVGAKGDDGVGVPSGGTTNMILTKASNANNDTQWVNTLEDINMNGGYF